MPDQTQPPAPDGCVYGPWWDEPTKMWWAVTNLWNDKAPAVVHYRQNSLGVMAWMIPGNASASAAREFCRVAAERDELRAQLADEEGVEWQAVVEFGSINGKDMSLRQLANEWEWTLWADLVMVEATGKKPTRAEARRAAIEAARGLG